MKFSTNYTLYPDNKALEKALEHYKGLISEDEAKGLSPDSQVAVADNFIHTRGNYEQHRYNANVLESARTTLEALLTDELREESPLKWAELHNSLGNILAALGQNLREADLYNLSIASFNHTLDVLSQEETPLEWAATKSNLGTALQALGRQEADSKLLNSSIDAYTEALFVYSRKETL